MLADAVRRFLAAHAIPPGRILAAVSGGADSTALVLTLADLRAEGFDVVAAHVNHHLRGDESDADEDFVREIARATNVACVVLDGALDAEEVRQHGVEGAARLVRYRLLQQSREQTNAQWIATAHQLNDQAETVLMRLLTGSGIAGLRGVHEVRDDRVIRPLLRVTRADIDRELQARGVTPRVDSSNADKRFLRNRVRSALTVLGEDAMRALATVADEASSLSRIVERALDAEERSCVVTTVDEASFISVPDDAWIRQALLHRHVRRLSSAHRDVSSLDLERLSNDLAAGRKATVSRDVELVPRRGAMVLRRTQPEPEPFDVELVPGSAVILPNGSSVRLRRVEAAGPLASDDRRSQRFQVPRGSAPAFRVRSRRRGDRLHPLGAPGSKKLKDILIDRKIEASERDSLPLLTADGEIVWVAGVALSENFRVTADSGDLYEVECERRHPDPEGSGALQR